MRDFSYRNAMNHPSVMFRRKIIKAGEFYNAEYRYSEDLEFWLRLARKGYKFENIEKPLIHFRENEIYFRVYNNWKYNWLARKKHFEMFNFYSYLSVITALVHLIIPSSLRKLLYNYHARSK